MNPFLLSAGRIPILLQEYALQDFQTSAGRQTALCELSITSNNAYRRHMLASDISLPLNWPPFIRRAMVYVATLAYQNIIYTRSMAADSKLQRTRMAGLLDQARNEISLKNEELRILRTRIEKIPPRHRPHYAPDERSSILLYRASRGWTLDQTAKAFVLTEDTISNWMRELETDGINSLVSIPVPHNKYPQCVAYAAKKLKALCPRFGKKATAEYFLRSGIQISASSAGRYLRRKLDRNPPDLHGSSGRKTPPKAAEKKITSRHPNHIWITDLTVVPIGSGFWSFIIPYTIKQCWPFCWWVMVIIDHYSRKAIGFALFKKQPTSDDITKVLNRAIRKTGSKPQHIITDKGKQFDCKNYQEWCKRRKIKYRYGAVGKHGSIAIVERFIKTIKDECTRLLPVPLVLGLMREELATYMTWYNQYRPHLYHKAKTPQEIYSTAPPVSEPNNPMSIKDIRLDISYLDGRKHLPLVKIIVDKAA